jgi:hypothetical protein
VFGEIVGKLARGTLAHTPVRSSWQILDLGVSSFRSSRRQNFNVGFSPHMEINVLRLGMALSTLEWTGVEMSGMVYAHVWVYGISSLQLRALQWLLGTPLRRLMWECSLKDEGLSAPSLRLWLERRRPGLV